MTNQEIYNAVVWNVFGDADYVPISIQNNMYGPEGLIAQAHHRIQADMDYWFMRSQETIALSGQEEKEADTTDGSPALAIADETGLHVGMSVSGVGVQRGAVLTGLAPATMSRTATLTGRATLKFSTRRYALPDGLKRIMSVIVSIGNTQRELILATWRELMTSGMSDSYGEPLYYSMESAGIINISPAPVADGEAIIDHYRIIPYLYGAADETTVMIEAADVLVNLLSVMVAHKVLEMEKVRIYTGMYSEALQTLRRRHVGLTSGYKRFDFNMMPR